MPGRWLPDAGLRSADPRAKTCFVRLPALGAQRGFRLIAVGFQQIDPHVEPRAAAGRPSRRQACAEPRSQARQQPVGDLEPNGLRHGGVIERVAFELVRMPDSLRSSGGGARTGRRRTSVERLMRSSLPAAMTPRPAILPIAARHPATSRGGGGRAGSSTRDRRRLGGRRTDIAASTEEIVGHGIRGAFGGTFDHHQQVDRGGDACGGGQTGRSGNADRSSNSVTIRWGIWRPPDTPPCPVWPCLRSRGPIRQSCHPPACRVRADVPRRHRSQQSRHER